jgi:hypothetical protein
MTTIKSKILISLIFLTNCCCGQTKSNYILFHKAYSDSSETNLYKDTIIRFDYNIQYANLKNSNVANDVERAIKNRDLRVVAISGNSYLYPGFEGGYKKLKDGTKAFVGLDKKYEEHLKKYGFKVIQGTSDVVDSDKPPLQTVAYNYAKEYNRLLFLKVYGKTK